MLTNQQIKQFKSYQQKKYRRQDGVFVAETPKVAEVLFQADLGIRVVAALESWWAEPGNEVQIKMWERKHDRPVERLVLSIKDLERISGLKEPQQVWMLLDSPEVSLAAMERDAREALYRGCYLLLDDLQDPGNMGTILRIADWFGLDGILCTSACADVFQPKCVQASMGSVGMVPVVYAAREDWIALVREKPEALRVYGTFMRGEDIYGQTLPKEAAWYVVGNEAKGISPALGSCVDTRLTIPAHPRHRTGAESLNAAVATAVLCSEIMRR